MTALPRFLSADIAIAVHDRQLAEHGGPAGVKDMGLLESAMARPVNKHAHGEEDLCALAAAYAYGIARNHPFVDGNKRTAWVIARLFLKLNAVEIIFEKVDAIEVVLALAAGECPENALAAWFQTRVVVE
ncbi:MULTISPECIES: type II toxin-antitoxin system death-on-curing family toxin [unclassified Sphingomonas]|jgi:death on curing protein|uniref:type II toxin-antitoxin system death-on-curing family toxin n=1 Tax=unclassified Sphingomonas TaxID=196159 RepID=UPI000E1013C5|nr:MULTISPECIES: type II toxin-antitoxin system death-on-curing family toxin [unclassified Sphingomonas]AXJ94632.1 type II toxin-antitoxin system death-on-curing family toxin [Sphingomonas sp. FARSPH]